MGKMRQVGFLEMLEPGEFRIIRTELPKNVCTSPTVEAFAYPKVRAGIDGERFKYWRYTVLQQDTLARQMERGTWA